MTASRWTAARQGASVGAQGTAGAGGDAEVTARRARKAALRRATRAARDGLAPVERSTGSSAAVARLRHLPELQRARVVALYNAVGSELDVAALVGWLRGRGTTTALPRVAGQQLVLVATTGSTPLGVGYQGIAEPVGRGVDPDAVDVVVLPGLAFDPVGGRLGQGGGHYDRLLARCPAGAARIGVGFSCQVVPRVPREDHDEPVDVVVTERATYRTRARD